MNICFYLAINLAKKAKISPIQPIRLYCERVAETSPVVIKVKNKKRTHMMPTPAPNVISSFPVMT